MKIIFRTNLDRYKSSHFPENLPTPPRVGEKVSVKNDLVKWFIDKGLPHTLEVVDVTWYEDRVYCELWYSEIDVRTAQLTDKNLF